MSQLQDAKKRYDAIPVPEELSECVRKAVDSATAEQERKGKVVMMKKGNKILSRSMKVAAAVLAGFTLLLNTNTAFAQEMQDIPVIGAVAKVLTFRSYEKTQDNIQVAVEIPSVEMIAQDTGLADSINQEILALCEKYAEEAIVRAEEYRTAFLETGGTEEEWAAHKIQIKVWYEIKSQSENYLSFVVRGAENWSSAYDEVRYYNIDLRTEKLVTLKDMLGDDYINIANESIQSQMKKKSEETGMVFWTAEEGGFAGITDEQKFFVNEKGNPVIVFDKYEIAPGSEGEISFEITK